MCCLHLPVAMVLHQNQSVMWVLHLQVALTSACHRQQQCWPSHSMCLQLTRRSLYLPATAKMRWKIVGRRAGAWTGRGTVQNSRPQVDSVCVRHAASGSLAEHAGLQQHPVRWHACVCVWLPSKGQHLTLPATQEQHMTEVEGWDCNADGNPPGRLSPVLVHNVWYCATACGVDLLPVPTAGCAC